MTSTHDLHAEKQRYAIELAEYTRRQWDTARRSLELNQGQTKDAKGAPNGGRAPAGSSASTGSRASQGIQSYDYAHRSHTRGGGLAHENRAVAAQ